MFLYTQKFCMTDNFNIYTLEKQWTQNTKTKENGFLCMSQDTLIPLNTVNNYAFLLH